MFSIFNFQPNKRYSNTHFMTRFELFLLRLLMLYMFMRDDIRCGISRWFSFLCCFIFLEPNFYYMFKNFRKRVKLCFMDEFQKAFNFILLISNLFLFFWLPKTYYRIIEIRSKRSKLVDVPADYPKLVWISFLFLF